MNGFNKIFLLGRLGSEPTLSTSKGGIPFTRLSVANKRPFRDKTDDELLNDSSADKKSVGLTDWYSVYVWGKQAELCSRYLKPGQGVMIEGFLSHYESKTESGDKLKKLSIHASKVEFLDKKGVSQKLH